MSLLVLVFCVYGACLQLALTVQINKKGLFCLLEYEIRVKHSDSTFKEVVALQHVIIELLRLFAHLNSQNIALSKLTKFKD